MQQPQQEVDPLKDSNKYEKLQSLGKGSFGYVQLAKNKQTGELAAVKFLKRSEINKYVEGEIVNHSLLRHPHVIQFKEVFLTSDCICIAMEYATGGSLFHYVQKQGRLKEAVARWFFQQLIIGVDYCHKRGVANRDIKLENTLLQVVKGLPLPLLKICDFGYSKADFKSAAKSKVGTLTYMAPEVLVNRDGKYDGKVADIWSCGVMLYVMFFGRYPFETPAAGVPKAKEILEMLDKMVNQRYSVPDPCDITPEGRDLLVRMLLPDPAQRIQLEQIKTHPWFTTNLPAEAATMNASYLKAAFPPGHQTPQDIQRLLSDAGRMRHLGTNIPISNANYPVMAFLAVSAKEKADEAGTTAAGSSSNAGPSSTSGRPTSATGGPSQHGHHHAMVTPSEEYADSLIGSAIKDDQAEHPRSMAVQEFVKMHEH